jgi:hypothetical protein
MTNKKLNLAYIFIASLILSACSASNKYIEINGDYTHKKSKNISINYVPNINIITKDSKLLELIQAEKSDKFNITNKNFAVLSLYIDSSVEVDPLEKPQPKLVGILKKQSHKYNYKVNYKLVDGIENTIVQGNTLGLSDEKTQTLVNATVQPSNSALQDAAKQIVAKINMEISDILIDFKIVSVSPQSVFIAVNDNIVLDSNEVFLVNELPNTALRVESIIKNNDMTLAELKVLTGEFPKVGMTVNLQK